MNSVFDGHHLANLKLPNRIVMSPMTRNRAAAGGRPTPSMAAYYAQRATAGLIVTEAVQPSPQGQSTPYSPGLHDAGQVAAWRTVTDSVHASGGRIFAQLSHAGRVSHPAVAGHQPVAPSAVALDAQLFTGPKGMLPAPTPVALSTTQVEDQVRVFADAARHAIDAGFDGVEIQGANGYLIQQFLSSNANRRTDTYGGSVAGRIRFAVEVAEAVAEAIGPERVGIRLSPGGQTWGVVEDDVVPLYTALIHELARLGLVYLHSRASTDDGTLIDLLKEWPSTLIVNPGEYGPRHTDRGLADRWLTNGADLISFGRAYIANPDLVQRLRLGAPLRESDREKWYGGGDIGYLDYPPLAY